MSISVIICAYTLDRWDELAAVKSCHDQSRNADEVILVVDYNDELFTRATEHFASTRVLANHETKGLSGARNTGARHLHRGRHRLPRRRRVRRGRVARSPCGALR